MLQGLLLSLLSALTYSTLPIFAKLCYQSGLNRGDMLVARFAVACTALFLFLLWKEPKLLRVSFATLAKTAAIGFGLYSLQTALYFAALESLPASTVTLILYFYPLTVTLLSAAVLRTRIDRPLLFSLILVTSGCCCVVADATSRSLSSQGLLLALGSLFIYSVYLLVIQKTVDRAHPLSVTFYMLLFTGMTFAATGRPSRLLAFDGEQWLLAVGLGLIPTALAISLLFLAVEKIGAAYTSVFSTFEPAVTLLAAFLVLGEDVAAAELTGLALIIAGIVIPNLIESTSYSNHSRHEAPDHPLQEKPRRHRRPDLHPCRRQHHLAAAGSGTGEILRSP